MGKLRSQDDPSGEATFRYTIENVSMLDDKVESPPVYVRNLPWKIGASPMDGKQKFGFFLICQYYNKDYQSWFCNVQADLKVIPQKEGCQPFIRRIQHVFHSKEHEHGCPNFLPWSEITDPEKGFIKDDTIILEIQISADVARRLYAPRDNKMTVAKAFAKYFYIGEEWPASNLEEVKLTKMLEELDSPEAAGMIALLKEGSMKSLDANLLMLGIRLALDSEKRKIEKFVDGKSEPNEKPTTESKEELK